MGEEIMCISYPQWQEEMELKLTETDLSGLPDGNMNAEVDSCSLEPETPHVRLTKLIHQN